MLLRRYHKKAIEQPTIKEEEVLEIKPYDGITKAEIIEILRQKGIEHNPRDKKDILYSLMIGGD